MFLWRYTRYIVQASHCTDATTGPHRLVFPITALDMVRRKPKKAGGFFEVSAEEALERVGLRKRAKERLGRFQEDNSNASYSLERSRKTQRPCSSMSRVPRLILLAVSG